MLISSQPSGERDIYTVSRLNREARDRLETGFRSTWVEGEISNMARPVSGHLYFTLKDARAQVSCALFRNRAVRLGFTPENGDQVLLRGQVSLYEARGNYQLIVGHMEEAGDGALQRAFEQLKNKLHAEGLFDQAHKKPLPEIPRHIGIITSPGGAAVHDVLTVLKRRFPGIPVTLYPTQVQGEASAAQIVSALQLAARHKQCDVLLLTRGGGSLEDLWPFNQEIVARAVYSCPIPVVSAVGHEVDVVITDFVADQRAATPSAAAELLSPGREELFAAIQQFYSRLARRIQQQLSHRKDHLQWIKKRFAQTHPGHYLQQKAQRLDELEQRLSRAWIHTLAREQSMLQSVQGRLIQQSPQLRLQQFASRTSQLRQRLNYHIRLQLSRQRQSLSGLSRALDAVSPLATLQRGYSITLKQADGTLLHDAGQVASGDLLQTRLARGTITSQVKDIKLP